MKEINCLNEKQLKDLHQLYQHEWWTKGRTFAETKKCVESSQLIIGYVDEEQNLQAFARVLTDYTFKALIFDVIVASSVRSSGVGLQLVNAIKNHHDLKSVKSFELYCLPELNEFYSKLGFTTNVGGINLMRLANTA